MWDAAEVMYLPNVETANDDVLLLLLIAELEMK